MKAHLIWIGIGLAATACASTQPPKELANARTAYEAASRGPAAQLAPADVYSAQVALSRAEDSFKRHGDDQETRDLAYAAQRRAQLADSRAQILAYQKQQAAANAQYDALRDQQVRTTSAQLATMQQALAQAQAQRTEAESRAGQASSDLARIASVKQERRGMVITLPGTLLFETGKSDLTPAAQGKLSQVAQALSTQDQDSKIIVEGHADSQGAPDTNQALSQRRADAVASYLTSRGIAADRVTARGLGSSQPTASNATASGRAGNRRVDIVVQPSGRSPTAP